MHTQCNVIFICNDGTCIDIKKKCNIDKDCFDSSDETFCDVLSLRHYCDDYNHGMPDISFDKNDDIIKATVNVSIELAKLSKIKEIDMKFSANFKLILDWFDTRLTWMNLLKNKVSI